MKLFSLSIALAGALLLQSEASARPRIIVTTDGEIDDRCSMIRLLWTGRDKPVKARYHGTLSGGEIPFTIFMDAPGSTEPSKVTAIRTHLTVSN